MILMIGDNVPHEVDTLARESTVKCCEALGTDIWHCRRGEPLFSYLLVIPEPQPPTPLTPLLHHNKESAQTSCLIKYAYPAYSYLRVFPFRHGSTAVC